MQIPIPTKKHFNHVLKQNLKRPILTIKQTDRCADPRLRGRLRVHGARAARPLRSHLRVGVDGVGGRVAEEAGRTLLGSGWR